MAEFYKKDAHIWIPDDKFVWVPARIIESQTSQLIIQTEDGKEKSIKFDPKNPPPLKNPDILTADNDLTSLSFLNEASVLETLRVRFCQRKLIYTYCGIVLVAFNPYKELPIYGIENIRSYKFAPECRLDPHIFAVAESAVSCLSRLSANQSIIISGESGAGKTVSAKYVMRYLANAPSVSLSGHPPGSPKNGLSLTSTIANGHPNLDITTVENQALASNPIMEAIGNAKTLRNDNSSRFGKYLQIYFDTRQRVSGAVMRTYLLEKSRVVSQAQSERNFHIFYQICAASAHCHKLKELNLGAPSNFQYLNMGRCCNIQAVDDYRIYLETTQAFQTLGFTDKLQFEIFSALAAILHFGNVNMEHLCKFYAPPSPPPTRNGVEPAPQPIARENVCGFRDFERSADLLGLHPTQLRRFVCFKKIEAAKETVHAILDPAQACNVRDSLVKDLYWRLFNFVVARVNETLGGDQTRSTRPQGEDDSAYGGEMWASPEPGPNFIGLLDIYGFEKFEINSFEQFCINYANEKLQQQFNMHVFKLEQEEYVSEGLEWSFINYQDNQACIDLIEARMGILHLLDEECMVPKGSDDGWCQKLYQHCKSNAYFKKPKFSNTSYLICHSSEEVEYAVDGFMRKNRDKSAGDQLLVLLKNSQNSFIADLYNECGGKPSDLASNYSSSSLNLTSSTFSLNSATSSLSSKTGRAYNPATLKAKLSVGSQFKDSLNDLMAILRSTEPHYIRCIKPNDDKRAFTFDSRRVVQQLRACGILETIRISAAGYPSRWFLKDFFQRYKVLVARREIQKHNTRTAVEYIVSKLFKDSTKYRVGRNKIFFRSSCVAHLENLLTEKRLGSAVMIQKHIKGWLQLTRYRKIRHSVIMLQTYGRGCLARRMCRVMRRNKAAVKIQTAWRRYYHHTVYRKLKASAIVAQTLIRGYLGRQKYRQLLRNSKAVTIQKGVRMWLERRRYRDLRAKIVLIQCCVRRLAAKRALQKLKAVASTVQFQRNINKGLENKIIELKQKLDEQVRVYKAQVESSGKEYGALVKLTAGQVEELKGQLQRAYADGIDLAKKLDSEVALRSQLETEILQIKSKVIISATISSQTDLTLERMEEVLRTANSVPNPKVGIKNRGYDYSKGGPLVTTFPAFGAGQARALVNGRSSASQVTPLHGGYLDYEACYKISPTNDKSNDTDDRGLDLLLNTLFALGADFFTKNDSCLPAHLFIMCLRYVDSCKDPNKADTFLQRIDHLLRTLAADATGEVERKALWLLNTYSLLNMLKQYSGKMECSQGPRAESKYRFASINFSRYYDSLHETAETLYRSIVCAMVEKISVIIIPAILENCILSSHYSSTAGGIKKRRSLNKYGDEESGSDNGEMPLRTLLKELEEGINVFERFGLHAEIVAQIYRQIFYQIGSISLNILLQNKSYCNFTKGTQIRYNLSQVESFCRDHKLQTEAMEGLEPLMVASRLLQARKTANDAESICEMSAALKPLQVIHLLLSYTPTEEFEQRVPTELVAACKLRYNKAASTLKIPNGSAAEGQTNLEFGTGSLRRNKVGEFFKSFWNLNQNSPAAPEPSNSLHVPPAPPNAMPNLSLAKPRTQNGTADDDLYCDLYFFYSLKVPFVYSKIDFESFPVPEEELGIRFAQI